MSRLKQIINFSLMFAGAILFTLSFNLFLKHAQIAPGGLTGFALIINHLFPTLSIGILSLAMNIPLFFLGLKKIGGNFVRNTIITTVFLSIMLDVTDFLPAFTDDPLLASIYGGVLMGAGMGLTFLPNSSTGGVDILIRVLRQKYPQLSMGQLLLILDVIIVTAAAIVFRNIDNALYAIITMYTASLVVDAILYGLDYAKIAFIITEQHTEITKKITAQLERGVTLLDCTGGYTAQQKKLIICAIKRNQIMSLKELVNATDPNAFIIMSEAHEVLGYGFKMHTKNVL